jgi:hypothetical protein
MLTVQLENVAILVENVFILVEKVREYINIKLKFQNFVYSVLK